MTRGPSIALSGGLDLVSPAGMTRPGTLSDCENYEVASRGGYSRISGFERFDGRPGVAEYRLLRLTVSEFIGGFNVGNTVRFSITGGALAHEDIAGVVTYATTGELIVAFLGGMADPTVPAALENDDTGGTATVTAFESMRDPAPATQVAFDAALKILADLRRAEITMVPGRDGSDVLGGFLLRDKKYAIRDLPRVYFEGGYFTDADEGGTVLLDGLYHEILEVRVLGPEAGFIAYDPTGSLDGSSATSGVGSPTITSLPVTGSLDGGLTGVPYLDGLSVSGGEAPYFWSLAEDGVSPPAPGEISDLSEVVLRSETTPAALWRATPTGWERVELGREMAFTDGTNGLESTPRALNLDPGDVEVTAYASPALAEDDGVDIATAIASTDATVATLNGADGETIYCASFDFSGIPDDAQITGIEVEVVRQTDSNGAYDGAVVLSGINGGTDNKAGGYWPATLGAATYGGASDLWGSENISAAAVKDPAFGVVIVVRRDDPGVAHVSTIDSVRIRVHYAERAGRTAYVWDGTSDIEIQIINVQILSGDSGASSAAGFITLRADKNFDKSRLINVGEEIRDAPSGGGNLIGLTASRDRPIFLPGQSEVDNNRSQYQWEKQNFFGQDRYAAVYGVSGAGPAMSFDGLNLIKVRSPLSPAYDIPRHIAKHGTMLVLGYFSGAVLLSAVGQPYEMRGDFGATAVETGDRLTALAPGGGDALIIVCEESTYVLRGLSPSVFSKQTVSAKRGAIEYTMADPGTAVISDSFGLFAASTPESFEPASRQYMSAPVEPWLRERLQATVSNEQRFIRPICALAVKSKNQYRMFFRDGAVLTMTMGAQGIEITRQRYYVPGSPDVALAVRRVWTGIDASGRERVFASFNGIKQGYVFEMDAGRSFDGEPIPASFTINPYTAGSMSQLKRFDKFFYGGTGGYADLLWRTGINGQLPTGRYIPSTLGAETLPATPENGSRRNNKQGSVIVGVEFYDLLLQVESLTNTEAPHTLQFIETGIDVRGDSRGHVGDP